ncbi:MAG: hypothetical protein CMM16_04415 [Rhodospirillaceae bacterium]|nr:hypothetical protein [Rhodospirillaceae bacterium]
MLRRISLPYMFVLAAIVTMILASGGVWQFAAPMSEMLRALVPTWVGITCVFWMLWRQVPLADVANTAHNPATSGVADFEPLKLGRRYTDLTGLPLAALDYVAIVARTMSPYTDGGSDNDAIVRIEAVRIRDGKIVGDDSFTQLVDPSQPIAGAAARFHNITDDTVAGAQAIDSVLSEFRNYAGKAVLVGHNFSRNLALIRNVDEISNPVLDTMLLSMGAFEARGDHTLGALAKYFGEEVQARYTAASDAELTARVFLRLLPELDRVGARQFGDAQDLCAHSAERVNDLDRNGKF